MEAKTVHNEKWFQDRVHKKILATNPSGNYYSGEMEITDVAHAKHLCFVAQKSQGYRFSDVAETQTEYLHFYLGVDCRVTIDGVPTGDVRPLTKTMLFDQLQQKNEYGRDMLIKPILRPLATITEEELNACWAASENSKSTIKNPFHYDEQWQCFEPKVMVVLLKKAFDLFGLIAAGQAVDKTKIDSNA